MFSYAIANVLVRPAKWKKYFNLINSEKDASRTKAIEVFPYFSSQLSKKRLKQSRRNLDCQFLL